MIDSQLVTATLAPLRLEDISQVVPALLKPPRPAIRLRPQLSRIDLPFATEPVPWHSQCLFLTEETRPGRFLEYAAADYYVQDAASLLALSALLPEPGETVCDLCASPGGKSTAILEALGDTGWLLSNESVESRLGLLEFNLARHGSVRYVVASQDPDVLASKLPGAFDAVLVDAPCSGQSLLGRGKQSAAAFAARTVEHCAARQTRILEAAAGLVRPGGRLVYSTCTFAFAENEGRVVSFLESHPEWSLEELPALRPWESEFGAGHYRLWPHRQGCGGAYAARLRLSGEAATDVSQPLQRRSASMTPAAWPEGFSDWGELADAVPFRHHLQVFAWPAEIPPQLPVLAQHGPEVAFRKGMTWFPSYALAMRRDPHWRSAQEVHLERAQAVQYAQGQSLRGTVRGWAVARWNDRAIGWVKGDGTTLKNHLPKQARMAVQ